MLENIASKLIGMLHKLSTTGVIKWYTVNYDTSQLIAKITFYDNHVVYNIRLVRNYIESNKQVKYTIYINEHKLLDKIFKRDTKDVVEELIKDIRKNLIHY